MKTLLIVLILLLLAGCGEEITSQPRYVTDYTLRAERFDTCMKALPPGPMRTQYNDWAEVVDSCDAAAYRQAQVCVADCPKLPQRTPVKES